MRNAKILPELASAGILTLTNLTIYNIITEKEFDMKKALFTCAICACLCTAALAGCSQATAFGLTKKQYSEVYGKTAELILGEDSQITPAKYETDESNFNLIATGAFMYFLSEIYKTNMFPVSEDPVTFTCSTITIAMLSSFDSDKGAVTADIFALEGETDSAHEGYVNISIFYDFDTSEVISFNLSQCDRNDKAVNPYFQNDIYLDGKIHSLSEDNDEERRNFITEVKAKRQAFEEKVLKAKTLNTDFTTEYLRSLEYIENKS